MRKFLTGIVRITGENIWEHEKNRFNENDQENLILKNFINLCISIIPELLSKSYDATEFFKLFYHFTKISETLSIYLIQNNIIFLFLYYFSQSTCDSSNVLKNKFPFELNLKINRPEAFVLGLPKEIEKKCMTKLDELKQKKKEKYWIENNRTNRLFMWRTLSHLLRFYRLNVNAERSPLQIGTTDFQMPNGQKSLFMGDLDNILNILNDAYHKISVKSIANIFGAFCYEDIKLSEVFLKAILKGFKERDVNAFRPYFAGLKKLLQLNDSIHEKRVLLY